MNTRASGRHIRRAGTGLALLTGLCLANTSLAEEELYMEHERYGAWEIAFHTDRIGSESIPGVAAAPLKMDGGFGWGTTVGYNFTNRLLVSMSFAGSRQDYQTNIDTVDGGRPLHSELDLTQTHFNATWHFLPGGATPYVTLGLGWASVDSNIPRQQPQTECWWDPWWGYTCTDYYPTFSETNAAATATAGFRWDFHTRFFTRVSYGKQWLNLDDGNGAAPAVLRLEIGMRR